MAKFVAYYNLCTISDTKEFLGLSKDRDEGNIITTLGRSIIMIIKLSTQKQIRSWNVLEKLSCKVVYDCKSQQYVGLFGNRYIRFWNEDTSDINKMKKIKFYKNIADLVCTENDGIILLYADGSCEPLLIGIESRQNQRDGHPVNENQSLTVTDANVFVYPDGRRLLVYFTKNCKTGNTELVTQILDEETLMSIGEPMRYDLRRHDQNVSLAGCTVLDGQNSPCLLTIWSDKRVFTMQLTDDSSPKNVPGNFISMLSILNVDNPLSVLGISKNCVAIYGANSNQEGASLIIYSTQFKVVNAKQFFKIYFNFSRLWSVKNHILLAMGQNLSVVSIRMFKEMLSEMIGSQVSGQTLDYVGDDFINEEDELEENLYFTERSSENSSKRNIWPDKDEFNNWKEIKADGKKVPFKSYDEIEQEINSLCRKNLHVEFMENDEQNDFQINVMTNFNDDGFTSGEIEILAKELEKRGASEQEITEKLLSVLMKADFPNDIAVCLRRYTNVSEKMLAKVLNYALNELNEIDRTNPLEPMEQEYHNNIDMIDYGLPQKDYPDQDILVENASKITVFKKSDLVSLVLSCSINLDTIPAHIRKEVDFKCAITLLNHLYVLITSPEISLEERPDTSLIFDDDVKILQWFGVILNTHYQDIVLSRDVKVIDILAKWSDVLALYKSDLKNLESLASILYSVVGKKLSSKDNKYSKWYTIEQVKLY